MALVTSAEVLSLVAGDGISTPTVDAALMTACIGTAGELIIEESTRIWEKAAQSEVFDGSAAMGPCGEILALRRFPVTYPADTITVTENGIALVVAAGYSLSANVIVKGAGLEDRCRLVRAAGAGGWAPGVQNITVTYTAGFTTIPERIKFVAKELAWLCYQQGRKIGIEQVAQAGSSRTLITQLSEMSQSILRDAKRLYR